MRHLFATTMAALAVAAFAVLAVADEAPELEGTGWVNAGDLSLARLRGKVVVLYFYEEG